MIPLSLAILGLLVAPAGDSQTSSDQHSASSVAASSAKSENGKTVKKTYKKVIKDGKVVEESGDRSALGDLERAGGSLPDLDKMIEDLKAGRMPPANSTDGHVRTETRVLDGRDALDEMKKRFPEMAGEIEKAMKPGGADAKAGAEASGSSKTDRKESPRDGKRAQPRNQSPRNASPRPQLPELPGFDLPRSSTPRAWQPRTPPAAPVPPARPTRT